MNTDDDLRPGESLDEWRTRIEKAEFDALPRKEQFKIKAKEAASKWTDRIIFAIKFVFVWALVYLLIPMACSEWAESPSR